MPLPTGNWKLNLNGAEGDLVINNVLADGSIDGRVFDVPFTGFWNESGQMIFFESNNEMAPGGAGRGQFVGYLFLTPPNALPGSDLKWTLCGHITTSPSHALAWALPNSHRITFGWFAQITQVV